MKVLIDYNIFNYNMYDINYGSWMKRWMAHVMQLIEEQVRQDKGIINFNLYNIMKVLINYNIFYIL